MAIILRSRLQTGCLLGGVMTLLLIGCRDSVDSIPKATGTTTGKPDAKRGSQPLAESAFQFLDISQQWFHSPSGEIPAYQNGEESNHCSILESLGGGVGLADFDRDGWVDAVLPGGGAITKSQSIQGEKTRFWRGTSGLSGIDVTAESRVPDPRTYTHGVSVGDCDDDGFPDVLITGYHGVQFWRNQGDGTWIDATQSSGLINDNLWGSSSAWGDINGDGWLDVYVAHYVDWSFANHPECLNPKNERDVCPPRQFAPLPDRLWLSQGDGSFINGSSTVGLRDDGKGLGVLLADLDADRDLDIYVANDTTANFLYRNDGQGHVQESGMISGTALSDVGTPDGSMGISLGDFNNDGLPDIWVANYEREVFALYRNQGECLFQHVSQAAGIAALGGAYVGFGTAFGDWDLNGEEDLVVSNGHVQHVPTNSPVRQLPLLLLNHGGLRFENVSPFAGPYFETPHLGRGLAQADLDHDGDGDLIFTPTEEPAAVLENQSPHSGTWLQLQLVAEATPREAIGARATVSTSDGPRVRQLISGGSYLSHSERILTWGFVKTCQIKQIVIDWPSGFKQTLPEIPRNARYLVREGRDPLVLFQVP